MSKWLKSFTMDILIKSLIVIFLLLIITWLGFSTYKLVFYDLKLDIKKQVEDVKKIQSKKKSTTDN